MKKPIQLRRWVTYTTLVLFATLVGGLLFIRHAIESFYI